MKTGSNKIMEDVRNLDSLIKALYESISGPKGQERQWDHLRYIFFPKAHFVRTIIGDDHSPQALIMDVENFIETASPYFHETSFYEWEVARRTERFGNIAHIFSTYESRYEPDDPTPFKRGINSIQLFHDGKRWWIINMIWDNEREDNPMPTKYLSSIA